MKRDWDREKESKIRKVRKRDLKLEKSGEKRRRDREILVKERKSKGE